MLSYNFSFFFPVTPLNDQSKKLFLHWGQVVKIIVGILRWTVDDNDHYCRFSGRSFFPFWCEMRYIFWQVRIPGLLHVVAYKGRGWYSARKGWLFHPRTVSKAGWRVILRVQKIDSELKKGIMVLEPWSLDFEHIPFWCSTRAQSIKFTVCVLAGHVAFSACDVSMRSVIYIMIHFNIHEIR